MLRFTNPFGKREEKTHPTDNSVIDFAFIAEQVHANKAEMAETALLQRVQEACIDGVKTNVAETLDSESIDAGTYIEIPRAMEGDILHAIHRGKQKDCIELIDGKVCMTL